MLHFTPLELITKHFGACYASAAAEHASSMMRSLRKRARKREQHQWMAVEEKEEKREPTTKRFKVQDLRQNSCEELPLIQWVISIKFHLIPALLFRLDESEIVEIPSDAIRLTLP